MSQETTAWCPDCEAEQTHWRVASTRLHLGLKVKWSCEECNHRFVRIDGNVDTAASA